VTNGHARVLVFDRPSSVCVESRELAAPGPGQVLVRMLVTLISPGTELRVLHRSFDAPHWTRWGRLPFRPGYSAVGVVEACGPDVALRVGQRVVTRAAHASKALVKETACVPIDGDLAPDAQVWFALAKIAAMTLPVIPPPLGRHAAVVGDGPIAQMIVRWLHCAGAERITVVGKHDRRLELAVLGGATDTRIYGEGLRERRRDADAPDISIDASGTEPGFSVAQALAARRGTVVMLGDPGYPGELRIHSRFVPDGLHLVAAHDGLETDTWNTARITRLFLGLVKRGAFRLDGLITHRFTAEQASSAYACCADKASTMGVVFDWDDAQHAEVADGASS
jgi:2-desacetyl-2-hydroxyethyl bacteriochlorophyllide A dehydrogenase